MKKLAVLLVVFLTISCSGYKNWVCNSTVNRLNVIYDHLVWDDYYYTGGEKKDSLLKERDRRINQLKCSKSIISEVVLLNAHDYKYGYMIKGKSYKSNVAYKVGDTLTTIPQEFLIVK